MEITLAIIASIAVLGLIALGVILIITGARERESLHKMIKSKDLTEYVSTVDEEDEEVEEPIKEVDIDEIPFLGESEEVN